MRPLIGKNKNRFVSHLVWGHVLCHVNFTSPADKLPFEEESFTFRGKNEIRTIVSTYHKVHFKR